jgi:hypothetical protein
MSVCVYSVFVLSCVQVAALRLAVPPSNESYRLCIGLSNCKRGQGPTKDCKAIRKDADKSLAFSIVLFAAQRK